MIVELDYILIKKILIGIEIMYMIKKEQVMIAYIESKFKEIEGGLFQKICNLYITAEYGLISAPGAQLGTNKTTAGTPDAYISNEDGSYQFIEYTTLKEGLFGKIDSDLKKCIEYASASALPLSSILYFHSSHPLSAKNDALLKQVCKNNECNLDIYDIGKLASVLYNKYPYILKDELDIEVDTGQILHINEFIEKHDTRKLSTPLDMKMFGRDSDKKNILEKIRKKDITLVFGTAGVGKTKLIIEVCKEFSKDNPNCTVLCIHNNDLNLYEDYKRYFSQEKDYLVFVDDANQISSFKYLLDYVGIKDERCLKVIATVRDYAKEKVTNEIVERENINFELIGIKQLKNEDIKKIAYINFGIKNGVYLNRIVEIAQGNARLAVMASKIAVESNSFESIHDATQLVEKYYEDIIGESQINEDDFAIISCMYLLGGIYFEDTDTMKKLFDITGLTLARFKLRAIVLNRNEIVDFHEGVAIKQSEQILSCYLAYYALYVKKTILISDILKAFFKTNNTSIISGIKGITNYFRSDAVYEYLKEQISIAWNDVKDDDASNNRYLKAFHGFKPEDTLSLLMEKINNTELVVYTGDYSIEKNSDKYEIELDILQAYTDRKYYKEAVELILLYAEKRQDQYNEIITILTAGNSFGINENSHGYEYKLQQFIFKKVIDKADIWKNEYFTHLFLELSRHYLNIGYEFIRDSGKNSFTVGEILLLLCDGSKQLRGVIWTSLLNIIQTDKYSVKIRGIFNDYSLHSRHNQEQKEKDIALYDSNYINKIGNIINHDSFIDIHAFYSLLVEMSRFDIDISEQIRKCLNNKVFACYYWILGEEFKNLSYKKHKELTKKSINSKIKEYKTDDFIYVIDSWDKMKMGSSSNSYEIEQSFLRILSFAFEFAEVQCLSILNNLLSVKIHINFTYNLLFKKTIDRIGLGIVEKIILSFAKEDKLLFSYYFFYALEDININEHYLKLLYEYYDNELMSDNSYFLNLRILEKFYSIDNNVYIKIVSKVLEAENSEIKTRISASCIIGYHIDPSTLMKYFCGNNELVKQLYFRILLTHNHEDYENKFLQYFIENRIIGIEEYISFVLNQDEYSLKRSLSERLSCLWNILNFEVYIEKVIAVLFNPFGETIKDYWRIELFRLIFNIARNKSIDDKQDEWISKFINRNYEDSNSMTLIFEVVGELTTEKRQLHINEILLLNQDFELFKQLDLEPKSSGWSGSEIPIIEKKIEYYKKIKELLNGICFINHKKYLADIIAGLVKHKKQRKIDEFLRDW